jgi:hypothetical protein
MPKWDKQGWWPHGMTRAEWARNPVNYISKYASKPAEFPGEGFHTDGARWWGCGGLPAGGRAKLRFVLAPAWVQRQADLMEAETVRKVLGGWWRIGGLVFRSPWEFVGMGPGGAPNLRWRGFGEGDVRAPGAECGTPAEFARAHRPYQAPSNQAEWVRWRLHGAGRCLVR